MSTRTTPAYRRSYHLSQRERTAIQVLSERNHSDKLIAKVMQITVATVARWKSRSSSKNVKGQGRRSIFSNRLKSRLVKFVKNEKGKFSKRLLLQFNRKRRMKMSYATAIRAFHRSRGRYGKPRTGNILTVSEQKKRLKWSKEYRNYNFKGVWFHDESFYSLDNQNYNIWNFPDTPLEKTQKHFRHLKFEAFISSEGKTELFFFTGRRTGEHFRNHMTMYKHILRQQSKSQRHKCVNVFFDRASSHTAMNSQRHLQDSGIEYSFFCPRPCEINVIERVWAILKNAVRARNPVSLLEAKKYLLQEWEKINRKTLRKLFNSISHRIESVIQNKGDMTEYWSKDKN